MTEYDYSPEAYERYLATQNRIAKWVDDAERHRPEFKHAVPTNQSRDNSRDSSPEPSRRLKRSGSSRRPKPNLFISPPPFDSDSDDPEMYGPGPGPMPLSAPGMMYAGPQPNHYPNMMPASAMPQPMLSPPPMMLPPTYITSPRRSSSHRHHHGHSHKHHRSPSYIPSPQPSPMYYSITSPPVSGFHHGYPPVSAGSAQHPNYMMMQQPQRSPYGSHYSSRPPTVVYLPRC
ncbi:hypothetical protein CPB83DRAFT_830438 [Crepidotus variabilis]|uniref:Uncharacterized protein n=1 Tax=Crepidotus variabilis TaxID=179855 RepID=A0A9P6JWQ7_9AGAR|nr:hypothetical protein CPB83DRAFT_830438 [Crepidotus variabilis]